MSEKEKGNQPEPMIILYVSEQEASRDFYRAVLNREPVLDVPGMTEFQIGAHLLLGLMPESGAARLLGEGLPHPANGSGVPRCELYLPVEDPEASYEKLLQNCGKGISPAQARDWGDVVAYGADPDGHIVAFACAVADRP